MNATAILLSSLFTPPDLSALGSDDWRVREAETKRLDNPISPLLLPLRHSDPEVDRRVKWLRTKNLKWRNDWYQEQLAYRNDYGLWFRKWFSQNRSKMGVEQVWRDMLASKERAEAFQEWGLHFASREFFPVWEGALPLDEFRSICDFHWQVAPMPNEVGKRE